jgi:hypothetical protein
MITGAQIREARRLLRWAPWQVAMRAKSVTPAGVRRAECCDDKPSLNGLQLHAIRVAFESAGIEFTNGDAPGVRLSRR